MFKSSEHKIKLKVEPRAHCCGKLDMKFALVLSVFGLVALACVANGNLAISLFSVYQTF